MGCCDDHIPRRGSCGSKRGSGGLESSAFFVYYLDLQVAPLSDDGCTVIGTLEDPEPVAESVADSACSSLTRFSSLSRASLCLASAGAGVTLTFRFFAPCALPMGVVVAGAQHLATASAYRVGD